MGKARPTSRQRRQNRPLQSGQSGLQTARGQERERRQSRPAAERMRRRDVPPGRTVRPPQARPHAPSPGGRPPSSAGQAAGAATAHQTPAASH